MLDIIKPLAISDGELFRSLFLAHPSLELFILIQTLQRIAVALVRY